MQKENTIKILVFAIPLSGHTIPLYPILNQLKNKKNVEIIVYSNEKLKPQFENVGANWRKLFNWSDTLAEIDHNPRIKIFEGLVILTRLTYYAASNAKELAREIDREKPDLILYDITCLFLRTTIEYYSKWYEISQKTEISERSKLEFSPSKLPPLVCYSPSFAMDHINYPNKVEEKFLVPPFLSIGFFLGLILYVISHFYRCFKLGFGIKNPFKNVFPAPLPNTLMCLVTVFPELQPRSHSFDQMFKFIGSTIDDNVKNEFSSNDSESLKEILSKFKIKDSKRSILEEENKHLVYVSMGSTFNTNIAAYRAILDGIKSFNLGSNKYGIKLENLTVVVSTGDIVLKKFTELINKNEYLLPNNILLIKSVPQIELLKRASVFITHSGQNSVSESVHYGVPLVCIPLGADQPLVSYRIADDLGIAVRLNLGNLDSDSIRNGLHKIFSDKQFYVRADRLSKISHEYPGHVNGANAIIEYLEKKSE